MKQEELDRIKKWLKDSWDHKWYIDYDHWHVDAIDSSLKKNKTNWFKKGIEIYEAAESLREQSSIPLVLFFSCYLKSTTEPKSLKLNTIEELTNEFSYSPPALQLYEKKNLDWKEISLHEVSESQLHIIPKNMKCYYLQDYYKPDSEYHRFLWFFLKKTIDSNFS